MTAPIAADMPSDLPSDLPSGAKRSGRWTFKYSDDRPMAQTGQEWSLALRFMALRLAEHLQLFPDKNCHCVCCRRATSLPIAQSRKEVGWRREAVSSPRQLLATWSTTVQPVDCSTCRFPRSMMVHWSMCLWWMTNQSLLHAPVTNVRSEGIEGGGGSSQPQW